MDLIMTVMSGVRDRELNILTMYTAVLGGQILCDFRGVQPQS